MASVSDKPGFDCCLPQGRSLVQCLGAHMFYSIIRVNVRLSLESPRKQNLRQGLHAGSLIWALIPGNEKGARRKETGKKGKPT